MMSNEIPWKTVGCKYFDISQYQKSEEVGTRDMLMSLIARFMGTTWGPSGADRAQVGPMLAPWALLSGVLLVIGVQMIVVFLLPN